MEKINCVTDLKLAISERQFQQQIQGKLLRNEFCIIYESLKPASLIKSTLAEISSSPYLIDNMLGSITGVVSGYLSKKLTVGTSHNPIRIIMGSILQFGITNIVAQHPEALKAFGQFIIEKLFHRNEHQTD